MSHRLSLRGIATLALLVSAGSACTALLGTRDLYFEQATDGGFDTDPASTIDGNTAADSGNADTSPCGADLATDLANCGACAHDCSSGTCAQGICTLVDKVPAPVSITVRDGMAYFGMSGEPTGLAKCSTKGCATTGMSRITPGDAGTIIPRGIVVDDTNVFTADNYGFNPGGVIKAGRDGGSYARLTTDAGLGQSSGIALGGSTVVWTTEEGDSLYSCARPSCAGGVKTVTPANEPDLVAIASDGTVVWTEAQGASLKRCASVTACSPQSFPALTSHVNGLAIDGSNVFWGTQDGELASCALTGCAVPTTILSKEPIIVAIAVDGASLYWATMGKDANGDVIDTSGTIRGCTMPNCAATVHDIATSQSSPYALALDAKSVYWVNSGEYRTSSGIGSIAKAPR